MREILFRGKRLGSGEWIEGYLIVSDERNFISSHPECLTSFYYMDGYSFSGFVEVDPSTVGQYTGMTDKNGKRIFEGDILRYKNCDDEYGFLFVEFRNGSFCVNEHGVTCDPVSEALCLGVEVIGNIYDNPEILKEA